MNSNKVKVIEFIQLNFHLEEITLIEAPYVPGGIIVKDKNNDTMLVYWDILKQEIKIEMEEN